ncbi:Sugar kinase of the NBD/HSP70 family, may contain an N-terminal HTH domain [Cellulomonas marina]|uniref:Sugar kinase of the NBD/HSP70 family, may contain an N-terminal HTH domain n=2 Tax=Cellulomonas marina TaxID=988821 RepID=A0A1I0WNR7_9CELL|nr:Sugar kinase of the NBD/HSP70 family, may contain an N-terminal HTH domain [Cellulomonas marina]
MGLGDASDHAGRPALDAGRVARQDRMREHNLSLALAEVVGAREPVSRAQVAARTGLSRAAVSGLVDVLVAAGLVRELAPVALPRAGRPATPLVPAPGAVAGLGLEVNVDYLGVRAVDLAGSVLAEHVEHADLSGSDPAQVLERLAAMATDVRDGLVATGTRVAGAALALPGLVDRGAGAGGPLRVAPNLGWRDVDLGPSSPLAALAPLVANEADLAARAEAHERRGDRPPSFFYVSGEIGIGGATVIDGELQAGRHGWAGEVGHVVVGTAPDGRLQVLEQVAGQHALLRAAGLPTSAGLSELERVAAQGAAGTVTEVASALRGAGRALGVALAAVAHVADVDEVVLGGTFAALFDVLAAEVTATLAELVVFDAWSPVRVSAARAGRYAALTGGALAVLAQVVARPSAWTRPSAPVASAPTATT